MTDPKQSISEGVAEYDRQLAEANAALIQAKADLTKSQADDASEDAEYERRLAESNAKVAALTKERDELNQQLHPTKFGFWAGSDAVGSGEGALANYERVKSYLGEPDVYRMFYPGKLPNNFVGTNADFGPPVVLSFKYRPQEIVTGQHDAALRSWFNSIPADRQVWWSYFHEPENDIEAGAFTAAQYRAAWDHILNVVPKREGLVPTVILMRYTLSIPSRRKVADYLSPELLKLGKKAVLAWDCYLSSATMTIKTCIEDPAVMSESFGLGFGVAETATNQPSRLEWFVTELKNAARNHNAQFVTWFESNKAGLGINEYDWRMRPNTQAVAAWKK